MWRPAQAFDSVNHRPANLENVFRLEVKKWDLPAKCGTVGRAHIEILFRSIEPTEINCVPKYTVAQRFGRGTVWYFCEKSNGISVITFNLVGTASGHRGSVTDCAQKKSDFVQKAGQFHDLAGRGTSCKKAGLSRQMRDGWQVCHHEMLCEKIRLAGIEPDWFISYLAARKQMICVGESYSSSETIKCGVPQGSVLGPWCYLV